jgi:ADP-heptose:LPS heptosyltransferase
MIVIQPFSHTDQGKNWPKYGSLIKQLNKIGITPVLVGSKEERLPIAGRYEDIRGEQSLRQLRITLKCAKTIICNEGGIAHLCAELGKQAIVIINKPTPIRVIRNEHINLWRPTVHEVLKAMV